MSELYFRGDHQLNGIGTVRKWIAKVIDSHDCSLGELTYQFINDTDMLAINRKYLNHDNFTDIITFDYTDDYKISADIFVSIDRVRDNASTFSSAYQDEMMRVLIHGVLHCLGYPDKTKEEKEVMREKENECLELFHVEHKI